MAEGLVPITREFLSAFYDKYPLDPVTPDAERICGELKGLSSTLEIEHGCQTLATSPETPKKIDHNLWVNREHLEEILYLLAQPPAHFQPTAASTCAELSKDLTEALEFIARFQEENAKRITNLALEYLPQDFRGTMMRSQKERSDARRKAALEELVSNGATIKERYALLWSQQQEKRRTLSQLASSSGMFKTIISYVGGIPQVLLDFLAKINDDDGPLEEQRLRYGPALYQLTSLCTQIHCLVGACWTLPTGVAPGVVMEAIELAAEAVAVYKAEILRVVAFLEEVFKNSPFLIRREDAGEAEGALKCNIAAGAAYEETLSVESSDIKVGWEWNVDAGYDVEFEVFFTSGDTNVLMPVIPRQKGEKHAGEFVSVGAGELKFVWDNGYSWMSSKNLQYKLAAVPVIDVVEEG